jgi:hypothetical protein
MPFTPDASLDLLFPEELIPQHVIEELPEELHVRPPTPSYPLLFSPIGRADTPLILDGL